MIAAVLSLFSSSGMGVLLGHVFGWLNRKEDAKESAAKRAHEIALRAADTAQLKAEWDSRAQIATIEGQAAARKAALELEGTLAGAEAAALTAAYAHDRAAYQGAWGGGFVDFMRGMVRPVLTFMLVAGAGVMNWILLWLLATSWTELPMNERIKMSLMAMEWVFFQASSAIGFWFGSRPSGGRRNPAV